MSKNLVNEVKETSIHVALVLGTIVAVAVVISMLDEVLVCLS